MHPGNSPARVDRFLWSLELTLMLVAGLAIGWYAGVNLSASREQAALGRELERQAAVARAVNAAVNAAERPRRAIAPRSLVGRVEVPRLGLSVIAREGVDERTLRGAVGHVPDTALPGEPGNSAFAGHRDTFFRKLKDIRAGDRVVVTTAEGAHEYVVENTRVVRPTDVTVLAPTRESALTLVTCYPFDFIGSAPDRFIVRALRADKPKG
jgi:sortase A